MKIRVGIVGYGNLGKGAEQAVLQQADMTMVGIFSRRPGVESLQNTSVYPAEDLSEFEGRLDVLLLCGGSAKDLPEWSPRLSRRFAIVDSYDDHENAAAHIAACHNDRHAAILCAGWDPGLFSIQRALCKSIFPHLEPQTFWGPGVSQGHSDALRQIEGVLDGRQYTIPKEDAIEKARKGAFIPKEKAHRRVCHVVAKPGEDRKRIREAIQTMPHYFAPYETEVNFVSQKELDNALPHGGLVLGGAGRMELSLSLPSNPAFTGAVLTAYGRAAYRLEKEGNYGAKTPLDVPVSYLCPMDAEEFL